VQLTAALDVLRHDPDADTARAVEQLASLESFAGTPEANAVTDEALHLVAALDVPSQLPWVLSTRSIFLDSAGRRLEAAMYLREAARLADDHEDLAAAAQANLNLASALSPDDPVAAADAARKALDLSLRAGDRYNLGTSAANLVIALAATADWDGADTVLNDHPNRHLLADDEFYINVHAWFAALRGQHDVADELLGRLRDILESEDAQDIAFVATARAFIATARHDHTEALRWSRVSVEQVERALSFTGDDGRWAWPLAARSAHALGDHDTEAELLELSQRHPPGHLAPMQRAEALLIRARLTAAGHPDHPGDPTQHYAAAIDALRTNSTPYHLAHGLLDHADFLTATGDDAAAQQAISEARTIATGLACRPLLERADTLHAMPSAAALPSGSRSLR
jgi:hypothetical protein